MTRWDKIQWTKSVDSGHGIRVYRLSGILTDSRDSYELVEEVRADLKNDPRPVLINLQLVERLTSAGVGMLATIYTSAQNGGRRIALTGVNETVKRILDIVMLTRFITTFETEADAFVAWRQTGWARE